MPKAPISALSISACTLLCAAAIAGCASSHSPIAEVAGAPIDAPSLGHWQSIDAAAHPSSPRPGSAGDPPDPLSSSSSSSSSRQRALGFLIHAKWLLGEARARGIKVSAAAVDQQLEVLAYDRQQRLPDTALPSDRQLLAYLESPKASARDRRWLMGLALTTVKVEQARVAKALEGLTRPQIESFYRHHLRDYWLPERRNLEVIGNNDLKVVLQAKREVKAGKDFVSVAKRRSTDQEAPGGLEHPLARGEEEKPYDAHVFSAPLHKVIGPVSQTFYYIFEVLAIHPAHEQSLTDATPKIRARLAEQIAATRLLSAYERAWKARTRCKPGEQLPLCGGTPLTDN